MKVASFKRLSRADYQGIPEAFEPFIDSLNDQIEQVTQALQNNLTFEENFNAEVKEITIKDNTPVDLRVKLKGKPRGILLLDRNVEDYTVESFSIIDSETIRVKLSFTDTAPLGDIKVRLLVIGS